MDAYLVWLVAGLGLIIAELLTGTFYLLFLGIAGLVGAAVAYVGASFGVQAGVAAVVAIVGVIWIQRHKRSKQTPGMAALDIGQTVAWEAWINQADRLARVRYRGASWDAHVDDEAAGEPGEVLYITGVDGSTLHVAKRKGA